MEIATLELSISSTCKERLAEYRFGIHTVLLSPLSEPLNVKADNNICVDTVLNSAISY